MTTGFQCVTASISRQQLSQTSIFSTKINVQMYKKHNESDIINFSEVNLCHK